MARILIVDDDPALLRLLSLRLHYEGHTAIEASGGAMVFSRDYLFASPSAASDVLTGRNSNGWVEWKAANGKTLDELKRQTVSAVG